MYCKCDRPKKKLVSALHESFEVCAKSLGGCGCEINKYSSNPCKAPAQSDNTCKACYGVGFTGGSLHSPMDLCTVCNGWGRIDSGIGV